MRQALADPAMNETMNRIVGGAFFGDPGLGSFWTVLLGLKVLPQVPQELYRKIKQNCASNDPVSDSNKIVSNMLTRIVLCGRVESRGTYYIWCVR
jgi:hypothetical protein